MIKMKVVQTDYHYTCKPENHITEIEIEASSQESLFALYFKEYKNRYKYCQLVFNIKDDQLERKYKEWISVEKNYANNGGDMW
jgi:hypothetical protein